MSQCYRVQLKQSVSRTIEGEDSITYPVELTEILPEAEMKVLLRGVLEATGWEADSENPELYVHTGPGGEVLTLDLASLEVTVTLRDEKEVSTEVVVDGSGYDRKTVQTEARRNLADRSAAAGSEIEEAGRRELRQQLRERLAGSEKERMRQLNELLQQVYAEALKRKAGQLGEILEVHESTDGDNYELVIRVAQ